MASKLSKRAIPGSAALLCAVSLLVCSGCLFQKTKHVAYTPPPPQPPAKPGPPPVLPAPPLLTIDLSILLPSGLPTTVPDLPEPPKPAPRPRPLVAGPKPPVTLPEPTVAPKLGPLFTPEQTREYTKDLDESLERVRNRLGELSRKRLNADQVVTLERIRTFQKQAEQARQENLVTAVYLARRADLLAQDLLKRLP
jgi:hypothetical protein